MNYHVFEHRVQIFKTVVSPSHRFESLKVGTRCSNHEIETWLFRQSQSIECWQGDHDADGDQLPSSPNMALAGSGSSVAGVGFDSVGGSVISVGGAGGRLVLKTKLSSFFYIKPSS